MAKKLLTKRLLWDAACDVSDTAAGKNWAYTCIAVHDAAADAAHFEMSPASSYYSRLAVRMGAPALGDGTVAIRAFKYDDEKRFIYLLLLSESGPW